ncbi:MAG: non-canonical purine NTP pyrophosphatase [Firmicutes bacterium]|nr:non-canonical purine NTP pyrophosphatase [Bacillota bacterium]
MKEITFITGNQGKAKYATKLLGVPVVHQKVDLPEIQSLDLKEIVEKKLLSAYEIIKKPVIVEDVSLEFEELGKLPGPFIRFFVDEMPLGNICKLVRKNRSATARCIIGFTNGKEIKFFEGHINGKIAKKPLGTNGFGWDKIFIPDGFGGKTSAELCDEEYGKVTLIIKRFDLLKNVLDKY